MKSKVNIPMYFMYAIGMMIGFIAGYHSNSCDHVSDPVISVEVLDNSLLDGETRSEREKKIIRAIWTVESNMELFPPDGDGGDSIGPLQIQEAYWKDSQKYSEVNFPYLECRNILQSIYAIDGYMKRYCPEAWEIVDYEVIARTHNGGPRGPKKESTKAYWEKVQLALETR